MNRRSLLAGAAVVATPLVSGCSNGGDGSGGVGYGGPGSPAGGTPTRTETAETTPTGPPAVTVRMVGMSFDPLRVSIDAGETVEWVNEDPIAHDVRSARFHERAASWDFDSRSLQADGTTRFTFGERGVYEYYCALHGTDTMCGAVLVGGATLNSPLPCEGDGGSGAGN